MRGNVRQALNQFMQLQFYFINCKFPFTSTFYLTYFETKYWDTLQLLLFINSPIQTHSTNRHEPKQRMCNDQQQKCQITNPLGE